ncbi:MAG: serine hydrolase [Bacteroidota bacterium]
MNGKWVIGISFIVSVAVLVMTTIPDRAPKSRQIKVPFLHHQQAWGDSTLRQLSEQEKLAQLFMVEVHPEDLQQDSLKEIFARATPGGLLFQGWDAYAQYEQTLVWQGKARTPLLIASGRNFSPYDIRLPIPVGDRFAAISQDSTHRQVARLLAQQNQQMGVHLQFLPSLEDLLGQQNRNLLPHRINEWTAALQQQGIIACPGPVGAYFPDLRDTLRRDSLLRPYQNFAQAGTGAMFMADAPLEKLTPFFHQENTIRNYWYRHLRYEGLILSPVKDVDHEEDLAKQLQRMILAGTDLMVIRPKDYPRALAYLSQLLQKDQLQLSFVEQKLRRVLAAKAWTQAPQFHQQVQLGKTRPLRLPAYRLVQEQINHRSQVLLRNEGRLLPLRELTEKKVHLVQIGEDNKAFSYQLKMYGPVSETRPSLVGKKAWRPLNVNFLKKYEPVILSFQGVYPDAQKDTVFIRSIQELTAKTSVVLVNFGPAQALNQLPLTSAVLQAHDTQAETAKIAAQILMGGRSAQGVLAYELGPQYPSGSGIQTEVSRLEFTYPEAAGLNPIALSEIDTIVQEAIGSFAIPGCQVLVAKAGKVVYHQSFGHHTYARKRKVWLTDLYDIASITKVAATTLASMEMTDNGRLALHQPIRQYFRQKEIWIDSMVVLDTVFWGLAADLPIPQVDSLNMVSRSQDSTQIPVVKVAERKRPTYQMDTLALAGDSLLILKSAPMGRWKKAARPLELSPADLLSHTSGLPAGLPILPFVRYKDKTTGKYDRYYQPTEDSLHQVAVAQNFYLRNDYLDSLWFSSLNMSVSPAKVYEYSDANMVLLQQTIDSINQTPINQFLAQRYYEPLGLQHITYQPRELFKADQIVPTEYDARWRGQLLRGYVHDPTAALLGGVSGNAGLFSNAHDLAVIMQMLLNGGNYGGHQFLKDQTVDLYTQQQRGHRGYGFDKPPKDGAYIIADDASPDSYGHTGFTGTCVWVDPAHDLVFVFLSNRVHPKANNWKLNTLRIRQRIHQAVYDAMEVE